MKQAPKNLKPTASDVDSRFVKVIHAFGKKGHVTTGGSKGFGSGALKVNGKILAIMSSRGEFVVKLPRARVDELVAPCLSSVPQQELRRGWLAEAEARKQA